MTSNRFLRLLLPVVLLATAAHAQSIIGIFPTSATAGDPTFTLEVDGFFSDGSQVCWTPSNGPTQRLNATLFTFGSFQALFASVDSSLIQSTAASPVIITVASAPTAPCAGQPQTFTILPAPVITSLTPSSTPAGSPSFALVIDGANFQPGNHVVYFDGSPIAPATITPTRIAVPIPANLVATARNVPVYIDYDFSSDFAGGLNSRKARRSAQGARFASNTVFFPVTMQLSSVVPNSALVNSGPVSITVTSVGGFESGQQIRFNGTPLVTTIISPTSATATIPANLLLTPGSASITYTALSGVTSNSLTFTVIGNPVITSLNPSFRDAGLPAFALVVNGSGFAAGSTVLFNGQARATIVNSATQLTATIIATDIAAPGIVPVVVNLAGINSPPASFEILTPLTITNLNPNSAFAGGAAFTLTVNGTGFENGSTVLWNGQSRATTFVNITQLTAAIPASDIATAGLVPVTVAGRFSRVSNASNFTVNVPGQLTSLNPPFREAGSGAFTLTVNGSNFLNGATVLWNGQARTTTFVSSNVLTAAITGADVANPGTAAVSVSQAGAVVGPLTFEILAPLTITSLNPNSAFAGGAAFTLTVNGTGFENGSTVLWNGQSRATTFVNASQMTAAIPATDIANAGSFPVTVSGRFGRVSNASSFLVNQPGQLTSLNPPFRDAGSGAFTLTVNGSNFLNGATVLWNGQPRSTFFASANQLTASISAADIATAGTAAVSVSQAGAVVGPLTFEILTPLTITNLNPNSAFAGTAAFTLTVNGTGFENGSVVLWNGQARATTFVNPSQMTASIPATDIVSAGAFPVTVSGRFGRVSNASNFLVNQPGQLTSLSPPFRDAGSGAFTLTVNGTNFLNGATVLWNGQSRSTFFVSPSQLTASISAADIAAAGTAAVSVLQANATVGPLTFEILTPLTITSLSPPFVTAGSPPFVLTVTGTGFDSTAVIEFNGSTLPTTFVNANQLTATVPAAGVAAPGKPAVRVLGRLSRVSNTLNFNVEGGLTLTTINPASVESGSAQFTLTLTGQNFGTECSVLFNGSALPTSCNNSTAASTATATVAAALIAQPGSASITVRDVLQRVSNALTLTFQERLVLTSLSPAEAGAGSTEFELIVTGSGFAAGTRVRVAGTDLPTIVDNATRLRTRMPAQSMLTPGSLAVQAVSVDNRLSNTLNFVVRPAPVITSLDPASGRQDSQPITLTVTGANFLATSVVTWNAVSLPTTFVDSGRLTAQVNATLLEAVGSAQVVVVNPIGSRSNSASFGLVSSLVLTAISPSNTDAGGPEFVMTLTGGGFQSGATVNFGTTSLSANVLDARQMTARVPASAIAQPGSFDVLVINPNGQRTNPITFVVRAAPRITSVSPNAITATGPAVVLAVAGSGFVNGAVVRFDGAALPTRFGSASSLSADLGAGVTRRPPSGTVTVVNPDGAVSNGVTVEVVDLTLRSITPAAAPVNSPGVTVNLVGTGFLPGATVLLDAGGASATVNSRTSITAEIPASALTSVREIAVSVRNPDGGQSGAVTFFVVNGVSLSSVNPSQFRVGSGDTDVAAAGSGFERGSVLELNGSGLSTEFVGVTSLRAVVPADALRQAGRLVFRVRNPNNVLSNEVTGEAAAVPLTLSTISPANVNLGGAAFTLRGTGSGFSRSTVLRFRGTALASTVLSATSIEAVVPADLIAAAAFPAIPGEGVDVAITAQDGAATSDAVNLRVSPTLTLTSVNPTSALAGAASTTITVDGTGFAAGLAVDFGGTLLATSVVNATRATAVIPASLLTTARTVPVSVRNAAGATAGPLNFTINPPVQIPPVTVVVPIQISGGSAQVGVSLAAVSPANLSGTLELSFVPADAGLPANYSDPAMQFLAGGRSVNFTIAQGSQAAVLPQEGRLNLGTVAGVIVVRITRLVAGTQDVLPSPGPSAQITITPAVPLITPGSVRIIPSATGFDVEVIGSSNARNLSRVTLTFQVTGAVDGASTFTIDVTQIFNAYFSSAAGLANGGAFRLRIPFTLSGGDASAIQSVSVTLTNSVGVSQPVSGGR